MRIKEASANLAQATAEDRASVNNLTYVNMNLLTQVAYQSNHMATKDTAMATMQNIINQLQE